jgi:hypothetical protein
MVGKTHHSPLITHHYSYNSVAALVSAQS